MLTWNWIAFAVGLSVIILFVVRGLIWLGFGDSGGSTTIALSGTGPARRKVELWAAWFWTCDHCGQDNFERAITAEITPEEADVYAEQYNVEPEEFLDGEWHTKPRRVKCPHCDAEYEVDQTHDVECE